MGRGRDVGAGAESVPLSDTEEARGDHHRRLGPAHQPPDAAQDRRLVRRGRDAGGDREPPRVRAGALRELPFTLGVASGDPSPTGVVLWTRLAPDPLAVGGGLPAVPYDVRFEVARDESFHQVVRHGTTVALPDEAHSVRVELKGLGPRHEYFYRFKAGDDISPVGRTRTTPPGLAMVEAVTFAFVSCQHFTDGYFTPYADVASADDIEAVIFLGDYIYEGPGGRGPARTPLRVRSERSTTIGSATASTRRTRICGPPMPRTRGSSPGTTTSSRTTTPTRISTPTSRSRR
jgi:phosphodiesterase/alkaline phosphatase D-like protein